MEGLHYALMLWPDFFLIGCGFVLCRYTALDGPIWQAVEKIVYYFLFPTLLLHSILKTPIHLGQSLPFLGAGLTLGLCLIALSWSLPYWPYLGEKMRGQDHAASAQVAFRFNSFIILSLTQRMGGAEAMTLLSVLIGFLVPLFNLAAVWPMAKSSSLGFLQEVLRNPLVLSTCMGLVLNLSGFMVPSWMFPALERVGQASLGLGLMAAGAAMAWTALRGAKTLGLAVLSIKHFVAPLIAWVFVRWWGLNPLESMVLLAFSATPTASSCFILASRMGFNGPLVASLVTLSTLLGALSLMWALGALL